MEPSDTQPTTPERRYSPMTSDQASHSAANVQPTTPERKYEDQREEALAPSDSSNPGTLMREEPTNLDRLCEKAIKLFTELRELKAMQEVLFSKADDLHEQLRELDETLRAETERGRRQER